MTVLVVGAEAELVQEALVRAGQDADVIALDPSVDALERLEETVRDPRLWFLIGDAAIVPLPDSFVDEVLGASSPDTERVLK